MSDKKQINVSIDIKGDVKNSTINGVYIESEDIEKRNLSEKSLLYRVFVDYLKLPSLQELHSRFDLTYAIRKGRVTEFDDIGHLWHQIPTGGLFPEAAVILRKIQLVSFVSREPYAKYNDRYYDYNYDYNYRQKKYKMEQHLLTPSLTWRDLGAGPSDSVDILGLGDIHLTEPYSGNYILNVVNSGGELIAQSIQTPQKLSRSGFQELIAESSFYVGDFQEFDRFELARQLYEFTQLLHIGHYRHDHNINAMSLGGFPIVVSKEVYSDIGEMLYKYGAVSIDKLSCVLTRLPSKLPIDYALRMPKWCLYVGSRSHLKGIRPPGQTVCSAWTMVDLGETGNDVPSDRYLQWMFVVGEKNWRTNLSHAVDVIKTVSEKVGSKILFEFDEETNWFGVHTPFNPKNMREVNKQLEKGNHNITVDIDK